MLGTSSTQEQSQGRLENGLAAGGISESTLAGVPPQRVVVQDSLCHTPRLLIIAFNADGVIDTRDVLNPGETRRRADAWDAQVLNTNTDLYRNHVQWLDANGVLDKHDPAFATVNDDSWRMFA